MMDNNNGPCIVKKVKSTKCASTLCQNDKRKGVSSFLVKGALTEPFNRGKAVIQKFYCCSTACIFNSASWTNIKRPTCFATLPWYMSIEVMHKQ